MCGIIGINSNRPVSSTIISSLKKLEYRGYDSAGIATLSNNEINEVKSEGRVDNLENNLLVQKMEGTIGIGHVRWATHGLPNSINAHPHSSQNVSVVHNGIIENSTLLKKFLVSKGHKFKSQTDTEVIVQLGIDKSGYRLVTNDGPDSGQEVPHFHVHIIGGQNLGGLMAEK